MRTRTTNLLILAATLGGLIGGVASVASLAGRGESPLGLVATKRGQMQGAATTAMPRVSSRSGNAADGPFLSQPLGRVGVAADDGVGPPRRCAQASTSSARLVLARKTHAPDPSDFHHGLLAASSATSTPPQASYGPVLDDFGPVYFNGEVDFATPTDRDFRAVFDVSAAADEPDARSAAIESAARFLNMHAQAGVPRERLGAAVVLHGGAAKYALSDTAYRSRYGTANPNTALLRALRGAGSRIVLCGQSAASRGIAADELADTVELALSAMTAIKVLQDDGYQIVSF